jgi:hypothetical protein
MLLMLMSNIKREREFRFIKFSENTSAFVKLINKQFIHKPAV